MARFGQFLLDRPAIISVGLAMASSPITHGSIIVQAIVAVLWSLLRLGPSG